MTQVNNRVVERLLALPTRTDTVGATTVKRADMVRALEASLPEERTSQVNETREDIDINIGLDEAVRQGVLVEDGSDEQGNVKYRLTEKGRAIADTAGVSHD